MIKNFFARVGFHTGAMNSVIYLRHDVGFQSPQELVRNLVDILLSSLPPICKPVGTGPFCMMCGKLNVDHQDESHPRRSELMELIEDFGKSRKEDFPNLLRLLAEHGWYTNLSFEQLLDGESFIIDEDAEGVMSFNEDLSSRFFSID